MVKAFRFSDKRAPRPPSRSRGVQDLSEHPGHVIADVPEDLNPEETV